MPGSAPLPRQRSQTLTASNEISRCLVLEDVLEADLDDRPDVGAGPGPPPKPPNRVAASENRVEDVLEAAETGGPWGRAARAPARGRPAWPLLLARAR